METQEIASRSQGNPALLEGELLDFEDTEPAVASGTSKRRPDVPGEPSPKWTKRRVLLTAAVVAALAGGAYYGSYWWTVGRFLVSTDDAYVKADLSVISAKVAGNITAVPIKENAAVQAGDTLAQIDDRDYKIAVEAARNKLGTQEATIHRLKQQAVAQEALIDQAKAQVLSTKASLVRATADFERAQTLAKQEFGSQQRLDQARADRDQAHASVKASEAAQASTEANLAVLNAQVREAEGVRAELQTSLDRALLDLSYTTVKAAFAGIVGNKAVQVGQYVQPGTRLLRWFRQTRPMSRRITRKHSSTISGPASPPMSPWMPPMAGCSMAWWKASRRHRARNIRCCRRKTRRAISPRSCSAFPSASASTAMRSAKEPFGRAFRL